MQYVGCNDKLLVKLLYNVSSFIQLSFQKLMWLLLLVVQVCKIRKARSKQGHRTQCSVVWFCISHFGKSSRFSGYSTHTKLYTVYSLHTLLWVVCHCIQYIQILLCDVELYIYYLEIYFIGNAYICVLSFARLAFFELTYQFRTTQQLQSEVIRHYSKQVSFHL